MSHPLGTYSFLPWLRQGLANEIQAGASESGRAVVNVQLTLTGTPVTGSAVTEVPINKQVALFGPGDLQGIDSRAIVRVEPRNWSTNFETNYFPFIEFYDEDFPWRYSPAAPDARQRLQPWLALVVLEEREQNPEFTEGRDVRNKPLPYVEVTDLGLFAPPAELWAWAHVHVNRNLGANDAELVSEDMPAVLGRLRSVLNENPDLAYSRVLCPRKLDANRAYHAFLMPSFESGRRAGLGLEPFTDPALPAVTTAAWENYPGRPEPTRYPFYHRWYFRTGGPGDFESLVRLLKAKPVDSRVGRRDMDTQEPGSNVDGVQAGRPDLGGILKLGGALRVPDSVFTDSERAELEKYENWATPFPQPIQEDLAAIVNLADDYAALAAGDANLGADILDEDDPTQGDPDPVITPPLYGTWHALTKRLLVDRAGAPVPRRTNWVHELNLDPRFRVAAGFGTRVVQDQQEKYMDAAWEQIGRVLEANQRIRRGQLARDVSTIWYDRHLRPLLGVSRQNALLLMAPLNKRVLQDGATVHQHYTESLVEPAMTTGALRRVVRPRGRLLKSLPFTDRQTPRDLLDRVNSGEVSAAPPKVTPPGVNTVADVADAVRPKDAPPFVIDLIRRFPWLRWVPLLLALLIILLLFLFLSPAIAAAISVAVGAAAIFLFNLLTRWTRGLAAADAIGDDTPPPESVDDLPTVGDFVITEPGSGFTPTPGPTDSFEAARFKTALRDVFVLLDGSEKEGAPPPKKRLDLAAVATGTFEAIDPQKTIPRRFVGNILLPPRILGEIGEEPLVEAMAYPEFDTPMYEPLRNLSSELFLPNLTFIEQNSITVLKTNQKFIESYMVGLNHELARELLWREYPTDQRGSYFRQFWDVSSFLTSEVVDPETLKETLRDIPPLDQWLPSSALGSHDHREVAGETEEEIVLVIRGELLKRYPTAVIYAHRACWQRRDDGTPADRAKHPCFRSGAIDNTKERRLAPLDEAEEDNPPRSKVLTPLYQAKIDPDIYFFGFDLDEDEARGGTGEPGDEDPGWFFVIKERPGEPRFGLDIDPQPQLNVWNDLSWNDVQPGAPGSFININDAMPAKALIEPPPDDEKRVQFLDDRNVSWNANMSSADLAYIVFQPPVLVAVHAKEMLPRST